MTLFYDASSICFSAISKTERKQEELVCSQSLCGSDSWRAIQENREMQQHSQPQMETAGHCVSQHNWRVMWHCFTDITRTSLQWLVEEILACYVLDLLSSRRRCIMLPMTCFWKQVCNSWRLLLSYFQVWLKNSNFLWTSFFLLLFFCSKTLSSEFFGNFSAAFFCWSKVQPLKCFFAGE